MEARAGYPKAAAVVVLVRKGFKGQQEHHWDASSPKIRDGKQHWGITSAQLYGAGSWEINQDLLEMKNPQ